MRSVLKLMAAMSLILAYLTLSSVVTQVLNTHATEQTLKLILRLAAG
jgi:hypothetical protein